MGKRFYCEFCDKSIPSDIVNRKKHAEGIQHQKLRKEYYAKYQNLESILEEERGKTPCMRHFSAPGCSFGNLCRYSHKTASQLDYLEDLYRLECHNKVKHFEIKFKHVGGHGMHSTRTIKHRALDAEANAIMTELITRDEAEAIESFVPKYKLPACLKGKQVPASLLPPTYKDFINYDLNHWG